MKLFRRSKKVKKSPPALCAACTILRETAEMKYTCNHPAELQRVPEYNFHAIISYDPLVYFTNEQPLILN
jgi:hypothetical protein